MGRFLLFLFRLVAITIGFVVACVVAACLDLLLNSMMVPGALADLQARGVDMRLVVGLAGLSTLFGHAAFLPSAVLIVLAEFARLRSWVIYVLGGGLIAAIVLMLSERAGTAVALDAHHVAVDLVCGMIGGLAYWLLVGHRAGNWLPSENARRTSAPGSEGS